LEPVHLGDRFKVNKKNINKRFIWENWFQNCFFNKTRTGSNKSVQKWNRFNKKTVLETVYETGPKVGSFNLRITFYFPGSGKHFEKCLFGKKSL
jgi:hypothetical protein